MKSKLLFVLGVSLGLISSCARMDSEMTSVTVDTQSLFQAQSFSVQSSQLKEIFLTVSDSNNQDVMHFNIREPQVIEILVPRGQERVFQLLALYQKSLFDETELFYGFSKVLVDRNEMTISINLNPLGAFIPGRLAGRVFISPDQNSGPSGLVETLLHVNPQLAPLLIERSTIVDGWINFLNVNNSNILGFTYQWVRPLSKISLFGSPKTLFDFAKDQSAMGHLMLPRHLSADHKPQESQHYVLGGWNIGGAERASFVIKHEHTAFINLKQFNCPALGGICPSTAAVLTSPAVIAANLSLSNLFNNLNALTPSGTNVVGSISSWMAGGGSTCALNDKFDSCLLLSNSQVDGDSHRETIGGFKGVFRQTAGEAASSACGGAGKPACQGFRLPGESHLTLLPGITAQNIRLYYRPQSLANQDGSKNLNCDHLELIKQGLVLSEASIGSGSLSQQITMNQSVMLESAAQQVFVCGTFNNTTLLNPIEFSRRDLNYLVGSGVGFSPANSSFTGDFSDFTFGGASRTFELILSDSNDNVLGDTAAHALNPMLSVQNVTGGSQFTISPRVYDTSSKKFIFTVTPLTAGVAVSLNLMINGTTYSSIGGTSLSSLKVNARTIATANTEILTSLQAGSITTVSSIVAGQEMYVFVRLKAEPLVTNFSQSEYSTHTINVEASNSLFLFDLIEAGVFDSTHQAMRYKIKPKTAISSTNLKINLNGTQSSVTSNNFTVNPGPVSATHSTVSGPTNATVGSSLTFLVTLKDAYGNPIASLSPTVSSTGTDITTSTIPLTDVNGIASFTSSSLSFGSKTLTVTVGSVTLSSVSYNVTNTSAP